MITMKRTLFVRALSVCIVTMMCCSCGYQLVHEKGIFGGDITSLYVPIFKNKTYEPHASVYLTDGFTRELISTGLFSINKDNYDGTVDGSIKSIRIVPSSLNKDGVVVEKSITVDIDLVLTRKDGRLIKRWAFSDVDTYRVDTIGYEDYNKKEALRRISARMARRFCSVLLVDY